VNLLRCFFPNRLYPPLFFVDLNGKVALQAFSASSLVLEPVVFVDGSLIFVNLSVENILVSYGLADVC